MPSTRIPTTITTGPGAPPPGGAQAADVAASLIAHITDPVGAHAASAISYDGGPPWHDGSTNPAADVETQVDKILTDLAADQPHAGIQDGADLIGIDDDPLGWHDGTTLNRGSIKDQVHQVVADLRDDTGTGGSILIGTPAIARDSFTIPADSIENHLSSLSLANRCQWHEGFSGPAWLGGVTNPSADVQTQIDKIITDLGDQTATDGAKKIGALQVVSTGSFGTVPTGSVSSQLTNIINNAPHLSNAGGNTFTNANTFSNTVTFQAGITLNTIAPFPITMATGLLADVTANDVEWDIANGNFYLDLETDNRHLGFRDASDKLVGYISRGPSNRMTMLLGGDDSVPSNYSQQPHKILTSGVTSGATAGLGIKPGNSVTTNGTFLSLAPGSGNNSSAGGIPGHIAFDMNTTEGIAQYRTILPTASYSLPDGGSTQALATTSGGTQSYGRLPPPSTSMIIEAYVFAIGWNGGAPQDRFGQWYIRGLCRRNIAGGFLMTAVPVTVASYSDLQDSGATLSVSLAAAPAGGPEIRVTPPTDAGVQDSLWWGYLIVSAFTFTDIPDFDLA